VLRGITDRRDAGGRSVDVRSGAGATATVEDAHARAHVHESHALVGACAARVWCAAVAFPHSRSHSPLVSPAQASLALPARASPIRSRQFPVALPGLMKARTLSPRSAVRTYLCQHNAEVFSPSALCRASYRFRYGLSNLGKSRLMRGAGSGRSIQRPLFLWHLYCQHAITMSNPYSSSALVTSWRNACPVKPILPRKRASVRP